MNEDLWNKPKSQDEKKGSPDDQILDDKVSDQLSGDDADLAIDADSQEVYGGNPSSLEDTTKPFSTNQTTASQKNTQDAKGTREWRLIEKLIMGLNVEQRRSRRWGIFFKSLTFVYLFVVLFLLVPGDIFNNVSEDSKKHTALVEISGVIADGEEASANVIASSLRKAFESPGTVGVILSINSPGGSPVQSGYVYDEIKRLRKLHPDIKVYGVISDIGASGAYYIAAAADEIYADKASLVGSIGVVSSSFGFVDVLDKIGVERRVMTAGEHKAFLDPFKPLKESEEQFWGQVLDTTHQQFISQVKQGRGKRLKNNPDLFTGLIWTGEQALELGLIDGLGSAGFVAREVIGEEHIVNFTPMLSPVDQLIERFGVTFAKSLAVELGIGKAVQLY